ncbi:MAG: hypothetical protein ACOC1K_02230 [Nanoarchaeota archaeon]
MLKIIVVQVKYYGITSAKLIKNRKELAFRLDGKIYPIKPKTRHVNLKNLIFLFIKKVIEVKDG